jgi:glycosyltransferase involved in cell wall biosynthesis
MKLNILGTRGIPAQYGGYETFAEELATRLSTLGVEVTVTCPADSQRTDEEYRGVRLKYVKSARLGPFTQMFWDVKCFFRARRGFDVVYMLGVGASFAAWIPRLWGTKVWINTDGIEWRRAKWSLAQRVYLLLAEALAVLFSTRVIADSAAIETYLRASYRRLNKVSCIAYGAYPLSEMPDPAALASWGLAPNGYYIVVCRLEPENHVLEIVEGFEKSASTLPLIILGDIQEPTAYIRRLLKLRSPRIRFAGTVYDKKALASLRSHARGYIHGHSVGGTNPSLLEAMACSNLVVAHSNPFNKEVLGSSGLFFETKADLAEIVAAIDSGKVDADRLGQGAAERIRSWYRWDQVADAYLSLLKVSLTGE